MSEKPKDRLKYSAVSLHFKSTTKLWTNLEYNKKNLDPSNYCPFFLAYIHPFL